MKLHEIVKRTTQMSAREGILFLRAELRKEKPHSVRRQEIEALLATAILKQLRRENRVHRATVRASAPNGHHKAESVSA